MIYSDMNESIPSTNGDIRWFAIRASRDFKAEEYLTPLCEEVLFPKETVIKPAGRHRRVRAVIPRVLFIRTTAERALELELPERAMRDIHKNGFQGEPTGARHRGTVQRL